MLAVLTFTSLMLNQPYEQRSGLRLNNLMFGQLSIVHGEGKDAYFLGSLNLDTRCRIANVETKMKN